MSMPERRINYTPLPHQTICDPRHRAGPGQRQPDSGRCSVYVHDDRPLAGRADEGVHRGGTIATPVGAGEEPRFTAEGNAAQRALGGVVADTDAAVVEPDQRKLAVTGRLLIDSHQSFPYGKDHRSGWEGIGLANLRRAGYIDLVDFYEVPSCQGL